MCEQKALGLVAAAASAGRRYSPNRFGLLERLFYSGSYKWNHTQGRAFFPRHGRTLVRQVSALFPAFPVLRAPRFLGAGNIELALAPLGGEPLLAALPVSAVQEAAAAEL